MRSGFFTSEAEWEAAFDAAMKVAADRRNWIRADKGESLLGRPKMGPGGLPVRDPDGEIVWLSKPVAGWMPDPCNADGPWIETPLLGRVLQNVLLGQDSQGVTTTALRITPEILVLESEGMRVAWKRLTIEVNTPSTDAWTPRTARLYRDELEVYVRRWFPLREELRWEWSAFEPRPGVPNTLQLRWMAEHFTSADDRAALQGPA